MAATRLGGDDAADAGAPPPPGDGRRACSRAFEQTPRELFVEPTFGERAYVDSALPISCGQTISQPSVVGIMTQALEVTPRCKVLEVGAGSGYQAAILARLARRVYAIERHRELARAARERIEKLDLSNVAIRTGDGTKGWPEQAPFDRIIVSAAAEDAPSTLLEQLRTGGIMVLPVGQSDDVQQLIRIEKTAERSEISRADRGALRAASVGNAGRIRPRGTVTENRSEAAHGRAEWTRRASSPRRARGRGGARGVRAERPPRPGRGSRHEPERWRDAPGTTGSYPGAIAGPDAQGIITYQGSQTVLSRPNETVAQVAGRLGLSGTELAAYNGRTPTAHVQELALPPRPGGYGEGMADGTQVAAAPGPSTGTESAYPAASAATTGGTIETAPLPGAGSASEAASPGGEAGSSGGWSPALAEAAIDRSTGIKADGTLGAPPSSTEPVPPEPAPRRPLKSPDLGQYQTGRAGTGTRPPEPAATAATTGAGGESVATANPNVRLTKPVQGPVTIGFNKGTGPNRNDGVDFAAPAGSPVVAAADGEVALVSQSLGGLGTIVLLRHPNDLLTVYGRIDKVTVKKGEIVHRGQKIGVVSNAGAPAKPRMHFEVRRGAESLDPMPFLEG